MKDEIEPYSQASPVLSLGDDNLMSAYNCVQGECVSVMVVAY
jgi:hypothetical protein